MYDLNRIQSLRQIDLIRIRIEWIAAVSGWRIVTVEGPTCPKKGGIEDSLVLEDAPVFHHERNLADRLDIVQRILRHRDDVCGEARLDRATLGINAQQSRGIDGHRL